MRIILFEKEDQVNFIQFLFFAKGKKEEHAHCTQSTVEAPIKIKKKKNKVENNLDVLATILVGINTLVGISFSSLPF